MSLRLLCLLLALAPSLRAASAPDDKLAGEDDKAVPTAVPTPQGDERGPMQVTRTSQAASSFDLPAFVVTGGGERQSLARRKDLGGRLDTSGGFKTSPGEQGAGKDQLESQGGRESLDSVSSTSQPFVGGLRLSGGYQPSYAASGYLAQELGPWFWTLNGDAASSEGGPKQSNMRDPALRDAEGLHARAGWRGEDGWAISGFGDGAYASAVPQPYFSGQTAALKRSAMNGGLDAQGRSLGLDLSARLQGGAYGAQVPGGDLNEDQTGLDLEISHRFNGHTGSALLEGALKVDSSSMTWGAARRSRTLLRGSLISRFQAFKGNRLGLGLAVDAVTGDDQSFQLGPLLRLEQRLGAGFSLKASLDSGLRLSRLMDGAEALQPWHVPDPSLKPAHLALDGAVDLAWASGPWRLSMGAYSQQGEDWFLPQSNSLSVLAVDKAVRGWRLLGLRAQQAWQQGDWSQTASFKVQRAELPDLPWMATYVPNWAGTLGAAYRHGPWQASLKLELLGARQAAPDGSLPLDPSADLSAYGSYDFGPAWTLFVEGRNLASQTVQAAPAYPDAAPYVGLGVELRF